MASATSTRDTRDSEHVGIPISWYFDPEILEIERRELFAAGPTYAGHVSLGREEGDYVVLNGRQADRLLVYHQGRAQLVSNVCRHRQARMLTGSGRAKNIACPIHNWAYDLNGRQVAAPHFPENPCLHLECTELNEWNQLLFTGPRDIRRELAALDGWTELSTISYILERVEDEEHDLNWKAFLEVFLEGYHIGAVHPGFRTFVDPSDIRAAPQTVGGERFFCDRVNVRWPLPPAGSPLFAEFQAILKDVLQGQRPPYAAIWLCLFSGQLVEWYPGALVVTTYMPLTPTRTRLHSEYYFDRRIAESRRDYVQACLAVLDEVTEEDHVASVALQDGRRALYDRGVDVPGPYQMPMEQGIRGFHDCLRAIVDG